MTPFESQKTVSNTLLADGTCLNFFGAGSSAFFQIIDYFFRLGGPKMHPIFVADDYSVQKIRHILLVLLQQVQRGMKATILMIIG